MIAQFWINSAKPEHIKVYETALASQEAALAELGPGVKAEQVHEAYAEVIQGAGYDYPFRCGRATGYSFLENPQLIRGDKTILEPGMVFAVDGSVLTNDFSCLLYTSPSPRDQRGSRMPSSA